MKRHHRACAGLLILMGFFAAPAQAQTDTIPAAAYLAPAANLKVIGDTVDVLLKQLVNDADPAAQAKAREKIPALTMPPGGKPAQPDFMLEYGRILNQKMAALLKDPKVSLRSKLNLAIVTARVAERLGNATLEPLATALVKDNAQPIVLWGLKAAQWVLPHAVKPGRKSELLAAIAPAVIKHPSGFIYEEAYAALGSVQESVAVDELMKLWEARLGQYKNAIPEDPAADGKPVVAVVTREMWAGAFKDKARRVQQMQMISDQLSLAGQYADKKGSSQETRDQLIKLASQCGQGVQTIALHQEKAELGRVASDVARLNPVVIPQGQPIMPKIDPLIQEIRKEFPDVKPPPVLVAKP